MLYLSLYLLLGLLILIYKLVVFNIRSNGYFISSLITNPLLMSYRILKYYIFITITNPIRYCVRFLKGG